MILTDGLIWTPKNNVNTKFSKGTRAIKKFLFLILTNATKELLINSDKTESDETELMRNLLEKRDFQELKETVNKTAWDLPSSMHR